MAHDLRVALRLLTPLLAALLVCSACTTILLDDEGRELKVGYDALAKELVFDGDHRLIGKLGHLKPPDRFFINLDKPTEREIRLLGVEGLPEDEAPNTWDACRKWMAEHIAPIQEVFVQAPAGTDFTAYVIYGVIYAPASGDQGGYVILNEVMLDRGFVKIRDLREIADPAMRKRMLARENAARREKRGLWALNP